MGASIKDIAKKVGVSISTVSYALNDGPKPVGKALKSRILEAARELDYRPSRIAKSMVTGKSDIVGVIHCNIDVDMMRWTFIQEVLNGIINEAQSAHRDVLIYTHSKRLEPSEVLGLLLDGRADGLIFLAPENADDIIDLVDQRRFPYVVVSGAPRTATSHLICDNRAGVWLAMNHLVELGHRKIGHLAGRSTMIDGLERKKAYVEFLEEKGLPIRPQWIGNGEFEPTEGYIAARKMLRSSQRPTAIFSANDRMAEGALHCARDLGLRVPEDLSIVGFDDSIEARLAHPQLTTVSQALDAMGSAAMRALVGRMAGDQTHGVVRFPATLIVRDSTSRPKEDAHAKHQSVHAH